MRDVTRRLPEYADEASNGSVSADTKERWKRVVRGGR